MMNIVGLGIINGHAEQRKAEIKTSVVQPGKNSADRQEEKSANNMDPHVHDPAKQKECPQMIVFSEGKLDRVNVNGIVGGPTGCLLVVMVFVNERINCLYVEKPMQKSVEKIIDNV